MLCSVYREIRLMSLLVQMAPSVGISSLDGLLARLTSMTELTLDDKDRIAAELVPRDVNGVMRQEALYEVFCDLKGSLALAKSESQEVNEESEMAKAADDLLRIDNMLEVEGVVQVPGKPHPSEVSIREDQTGCQKEYWGRISKIGTLYDKEMDNYKKLSSDFERHLNDLLNKQRSFRPISSEDSDKMMKFLELKFSRVQIQLKQNFCETVMKQKVLLLDARRKRRNFSKEATIILNRHFHSILHHPYPSEHDKEDLASQCNMTIAQVSNWFGNKRIRYKQNTVKRQSGIDAYSSDNLKTEQSSDIQAYYNYSPLNMMFGPTGLPNPYQGMMLPLPPPNMDNAMFNPFSAQPVMLPSSGLDFTGSAGTINLGFNPYMPQAVQLPMMNSTPPPNMDTSPQANGN